MALGRFFGRSEAQAPQAIVDAVLRSDRFRIEREDEWRRLDAIVTAMEKGRIRKVSDADLMELPVLYRIAASSLTVARETSLDAAMLDYLEALVQRAWFQVYGPREGFFGWVRRFLGGGWSASVRGIWLEICIALAAMIGGTIAGWLLVARDQDWYHALVPGSFADSRAPGASAEVLRKTLEGQQGAEGLSIFAAYLFSNNAGVSILAFALGFAFGIPSLMLLIHNTAVLGAMLWLFFSAGLGWEFAAWLSIHGTTELLAILLAGAAGLHIGRSMAFPGERSVLAAAAESGRRAAQVMVGVVIMLIVAALLEGYARQLLTAAPARAMVGGGMLLLWLGYFIGLRRRAGAVRP
jgi:uncharacterized membrane protein SpoIIM required for sporulation